MIKFVTLLLLSFSLSAVLADNTRSYKLPDLRKEYLEASKDENAGVRFHAKMSAYREDDPVVLAYKAASEAVMAKYVWNPYSKLKHLKTAASIFEDAVGMDEQHPEIRFLRFTVEYYVPRYLNLSEHLEEDKEVIITGLKQHPRSGLSTVMARTMRDFLLSEEHCSPAERRELLEIRL